MPLVCFLMLVPVPAAAVSYMMCKILLIAQDFAPSYNNTNTQLGDRDLYTGYHASTTRQRLKRPTRAWTHPAADAFSCLIFLCNTPT